MNKNAIKKFAIDARNKLIASVTDKEERIETYLGQDEDILDLDRYDIDDIDKLDESVEVVEGNNSEDDFEMIDLDDEEAEKSFWTKEQE